ncbi:unnamed protein product [Arabidopsis thaliana]|uniref:RING-type E3 ubiquitin transferase n=1 Tax=Arabidopsis thaliana TaxID=3702 RepID=A0A7G2FDY9_ARATH|nr:unnamed protein product [Arabidopsis thaliana]
MSSAKLFGCSINVNVEAEEEEGGDGGSSTNVEVSRSGNQPDCEAMSFSNQMEIGVRNTYYQFLESNSDSGSDSMYAEPEFIDFFDRESYEVDTVREVCVSSNQMVSTPGYFNIWDQDVDLGLGIGLGSRSGSGQLPGDSGGVGVEVGRGVTPVEYNLFGEEAMVVDEVLEWENFNNAIHLVQEPAYASMEGEEEEEEDEVVMEFAASIYSDAWEILLYDNMTNSAPMDLDVEVWLDSVDGYAPMDYNAIIGQMFDNETGIKGTPPASKSVVDGLPDVELTIEELSSVSIVCAICKDEVVFKEKVKRLPCKHYYHGECIIPWLGIRNTCPVCRHELPTDDLEYERKRRA